MARGSASVARALSQLGQRIRLLRLERHLSQEEAAHRAGLDAKHWSAVEHAATNPTFASLVCIARALRIDLREMFDT